MSLTRVPASGILTSTNFTFQSISVTATNAVNSTVTGALQVAGGVGVGGGLFVGGVVTATTFVGAFTGNITGTASTATSASTAYATIGSHTAGTGLTGTAFNGSANQTWSLNTSTLMQTAVTALSASGSAGSVANALTISTGLSGTVGTYNGSAAVTVSLNTSTLMATAVTALSASGSAGSVANSVTFNNGGSGDASGTTFNGGTARTISYNTVGAPSTAGANASGTWGISISGNAATATSSAKLSVPDLRSTSITPGYFGAGLNTAFMSNSTDSLSDGGTYHGILQLQQWSDASGGGAHQLGFTDNNNIWHRGSSGALTTWSTWYKFLDSNNYSSYVPTLTGTGASGTWGINVTGSAGSVANALTISTGLSGSVGTYNGSAAVTLSLNTATYMAGAVLATSASKVTNAHSAGTGLTGTAFDGSSAQTWSLNTSTLMQTAVTALSASGSAGSVANALTVGTGLSGTVGTYNGSAAVTVSLNTATYMTSAVLATSASKVANAHSAGTGLTGTAFDGSSAQTWSLNTSTLMQTAVTALSVSGSAGSTVAAVTFNNGGSGAASGTTFNGGTAQTISYNTVGAPSTTGANASGSWGIYTNGIRQSDGTSWLNAASAIGSSGSRSVDLAPNTYSQGIFSEFKGASLYGTSGNYSGLITYANWVGTTASTGDPSYQLLFSPSAANATSNPSLKFRAGIDTTWGAWNTIVHSGNIGSYAVASSGGTITGNITLNGTAPQVSLTNGTSNYISFNTNGVSAPTFNASSTGTKILLYPNVSSIAADFAIGISSSTLWTGVPNSGQQFQWFAGTSAVATLSGAGALSTVGDITAFSSDKRLKTDIRPITNATSKVMSLTGIVYKWNDLANSLAGYNTHEDVVGLFAQDVQSVLPEAVKPAPFDTEQGVSKSGENYLTVQYEKVVPLLVQAIKEQQAMIEELRAEIQQLKATK